MSTPSAHAHGVAGGVGFKGFAYANGVVENLASGGGGGGGRAASASFRLRTRCVTRYRSLSFSTRSFAAAASACAAGRAGGAESGVSAAQP